MPRPRTPKARSQRARPLGSPKPDVSGPLVLSDPAFQSTKVAVALRCMQLREQGLVYAEIPDQLVKEFGIKKPTVCTVHRWMNKLEWAVTKDFAAIQERVRMDCFWQIERLKKTWIPIALGQSRDGEDRDEDFTAFEDGKTFQKRARAAEIVLNCVEKQAKLLQLDVKCAGTEKKLTYLDLQLWIIDRVNGVPNPLDKRESPHPPPEHFLA